MPEDDLQSLVKSEGVQKLFKLVARLEQSLAEPVYPVVGLQNAIRPMPVASCIAIQVGRECFIVTARHVVEFSRDIPLGVLLPDGLWPLAGRWLFTKPAIPGGADRLDIGVLYPNKTLLRHLKKAPAAKLENIAPWHGSAATEDQWPMHIVTGFPEKLQPRRMKGSEYAAGVWTLAARESPPDDYTLLGIDPWAHVLLRFDQQRVGRREGPAKAPNPVGSSGGAIWAVVLDETGPSTRLCGVATTWMPDANQIMGTRMHVALSAIWQKSPELRRLIERVGV